MEDARFNNWGLFAEATHHLSSDRRLMAGLRADQWKADDQRQTISVGMSSVANPTMNQNREETLGSGFVRYEWDWSEASTAYIGLGRSQRAPDYWELIGKEAVGQNNTTSISAFNNIRPEKTTQLDVGATWKAGPLRGFVSGFYGKVEDYILIQSNYAKPSLMGMGTRMATVARNVDATTYGGEAGVDYLFSPAWKGLATVAYVRGQNDSDHRALGQMPPLEVRLGLDWNNGHGAISTLRLNHHKVFGRDSTMAKPSTVAKQWRRKTFSWGLVLAALGAATSACADSDVVLIDHGDPAYTVFAGLPAGRAEDVARKIVGKPLELVTFGEFEGHQDKFVLQRVVQDEHPGQRVAEGVVALMRKYPNTPFGVTWNGGIAFTRMDYQFAKTRFELFNKDTQEYQRTVPSADPVAPGNHLKALLGW